MIIQSTIAAAAGAIAVSVLLAGCDRHDQTEAKKAATAAVKTLEQKTRDLGNDAATGVDKAKQATVQVGAKIGEKIDDTLITTRVKTELAKDSALGSADFGIASHEGRVALTGRAPNRAAGERAARLAASVPGVTGVDNRLTSP